MTRNNPPAAPVQAGSDLSPLQLAYLAALRRRVDRGGRVVLPTGTVDADELRRVLAALDRAGARR